jgi:hypothetical protein
MNENRYVYKISDKCFRNFESIAKFFIETAGGWETKNSSRGLKQFQYHCTWKNTSTQEPILRSLVTTPCQRCKISKHSTQPRSSVKNRHGFLHQKALYIHSFLLQRQWCTCTYAIKVVCKCVFKIVRKSSCKIVCIITEVGQNVGDTFFSLSNGYVLIWQKMGW